MSSQGARPQQFRMIEKPRPALKPSATAGLPNADKGKVLEASRQRMQRSYMERVYDEDREALERIRRHTPKERKCMRCQSTFVSTGPGHRHCNACRFELGQVGPSAEDVAV